MNWLIQLLDFQKSRHSQQEKSDYPRPSAKADKQTSFGMRVNGGNVSAAILRIFARYCSKPGKGYYSATNLQIKTAPIAGSRLFTGGDGGT